MCLLPEVWNTVHVYQYQPAVHVGDTLRSLYIHMIHVQLTCCRQLLSKSCPVCEPINKQLKVSNIYLSCNATIDIIDTTFAYIHVNIEFFVNILCLNLYKITKVSVMLFDDKLFWLLTLIGMKCCKSNKYTVACTKSSC